MNRTATFLCVAGLLHATGVLFGSEGIHSPSEMAAAPTATIFSNEKEVCEGSPVAAYLYFSGEGPWDAVISDKDGIYLELTDVNSPHTIWLEPAEDNVYTISYVEDRLGATGNTYGEVALTVNPLTPVSIELDRLAYLNTESGIPLSASPSGGTFTGNGVSANVFYPGIASPVGSPHSVTYTYYNQFGCVSRDETEMYVLYGDASVVLLSGNDTIGDLCDDGRTYVILGSNSDQFPGQFLLKEAGGTDTVEGNITDEDLTDDLAFLNPSGLSGDYEIEYSYSIEGLTVTASFPFRVGDLGQVAITGLPDTVCSSDDPYPLIPDLAGEDPGAVYKFGGPGVTGNQADGYFFDPGGSDTILGDIEIELEYTGSNGCSVITYHPVNNLFSPEVSFGLSPVCLPAGGGTVTFSNLTGGKYAVDSWEWDFGDPGSGSENSSDEENPTHFYSEPGYVEISLTATTGKGCVAVHQMDTFLVDQPEADFTWITDCYIPGKKTGFISLSDSELSPLDTLTWTFRTSDGGVLGVIGSNDPTDTTQFRFTVRDRYIVDLFVQNQAGCNGEVSREVVLQPTIKLKDEGYRAGFNSAWSSWIPESADSLLSWKREEPDFNGFDRVEGDRAWFTDLPAEDGDYLENSWIRSPCFDFSDRKNPLIQMDVMKSFTPGFDGAVLQYQESMTEGWKTIGEVGEGLNWYNVSALVNRPGGSSEGWGLQLFEPDTEWVNASHGLDALAGLPHVRLRIAVSTGGERDIGNQGFAFDNIFIGDRIRKSILEHFTNASCVACQEADDQVDNFSEVHSGSVIDLQYHTAFPGNDPMNDNNPYPASVRRSNYGINTVPYALLNGGKAENSVYDFGPDGMPDDEALKQASLELPDFDVNIGVTWLDNSLEATASVTCLADTFTSNIQLYVAVIETSVTAYSGINQDNEFKNVVLDMLPAPTGKLLGNAWSNWMTETMTYTWDYPAYIEDREDLAVVAFIQNRDNGQILQADDATLALQVDAAEYTGNRDELRVWPNPVSDQLYIDLGVSVQDRGTLNILDLTGKTVLTGKVHPGKSTYLFNLARLPGGVYVVLWEESGSVRGRTRVMVIR
jgi:PKD repeat protein